MAKKYIDADKLIANLERRKEEYKEDRYMSDYRGQISYYKDEIYDDLLSFIDSLQQEQPCDTCTNDKGCVACKDALLGWAKEQLDILNKQTLLHPDDEVFWGQRNAFKQLIDKLNEM